MRWHGSSTAKIVATKNARKTSAAFKACASRRSVGSRSATLSNPRTDLQKTSASPVLTAARTRADAGRIEANAKLETAQSRVAAAIVR